MDAHAIAVGLGALALAATSGFGGAYLGARATARNDRIERERQRRIEAADDLVQAWGEALFAIGEAIRAMDASNPLVDGSFERPRDLTNKATLLSTRVDLLFTTVSPAAKNANSVRDCARASVRAGANGKREEARLEVEEASKAMESLVDTLGEAIHSTGTRRDVARRFKELRSGAEDNTGTAPPER